MNDYKIIALTRGYETKVDSEDYDWLVKKTWHYVGSLHSLGYARWDWRHKGKLYTELMHRLIMEYHDYDIENSLIDHINGDTLDNRKVNLRLANHSQNINNRGIQKNNTSGFKNVQWCNHRNKWRVVLIKVIDGKKTRFSGGRFENIIDAAKKANELILLHHGEFAKLNIIPE